MYTASDQLSPQTSIHTSRKEDDSTCGKSKLTVSLHWKGHPKHPKRVIQQRGSFGGVIQKSRPFKRGGGGYSS